MRPRIALIIAAAFVLVLCEGMADQAAAKVVRNNNAAPSNPAVEAGGHRLRPGASPPVQYSLVGAMAAESPWPTAGSPWLASETRWLGQCAIWPWRFFGSLSFHDPGRFGRIPARPPIDWVLPPLP